MSHCASLSAIFSSLHTLRVPGGIWYLPELCWSAAHLIAYSAVPSDDPSSTSISSQRGLTIFVEERVFFKVGAVVVVRLIAEEEEAVDSLSERGYMQFKTGTASSKTNVIVWFRYNKEQLQKVQHYYLQRILPGLISPMTLSVKVKSRYLRD